VTHAVHQRRAAIARDDVFHGVAGAQVVDDRRARRLQQKRLGQERGDEISRDELAGPVDEEAAIGIAVPRDADIGLFGDDALHDVAPILLDEGIGLVVRKAPVDLEAETRGPAGEALEQFRRDEAAHAAAGIEHDVERADGARVDETNSRLASITTQVTALNGQIAAKEREILDLQARVAPLMAQLDGLNGEISATETKLTELQAQLTGLDQKLTDANTTLANLQAKKGANKDSIAAQKKTVTGLQDQLGSIQNQIRAIDGQIGLGGCAA